MERWKTQTREERLQDAWENRNKFEIRPDQGGLPRVNIPMNTMLFLTVIFVVAVFLAKYWLKIITFIHQEADAPELLPSQKLSKDIYK